MRERRERDSKGESQQLMKSFYYYQLQGIQYIIYFRFQIKTVEVKKECKEELRTPDKDDASDQRHTVGRSGEKTGSARKKKIDTPQSIIRRRNLLLSQARARWVDR